MTTHQMVTNPIVVGFGIACVAVLALTLLTLRQHHDRAAVGLGVLLLGLWAFSKLSIVTFGYWPTAGAGPVINTGAVIICMLSWVQQPRLWKLALAILMEAKAVIHALFWTMHGPTYDQTYNYILTLNLIFAAELLCVAWPGVSSLASTVGSRLARGGSGGRDGVRVGGAT